MPKRTNHSPSFKAKAALEALRGERTVSGLAAKYEIHPTLETRRKRQAADGLVEVFDAGGRHDQYDLHAPEVKELHAKVGRLTAHPPRALCSSLHHPGGRLWGGGSA